MSNSYNMLKTRLKIFTYLNPNHKHKNIASTSHPKPAITKRTIRSGIQNLNKRQLHIYFEVNSLC